MTDLAVRAEIEQAHGTLLDHWSRPGTWWSAEERLAIVAEVRAARSNRQVGPLGSPASDDSVPTGPVDDPLPTPVIDAVWRIANHPGTLSKAWHDSLLAGGLEPLAYVELLAVVSMATCLDSFDRAVGRPPLAAPAGQAGGGEAAAPPAVTVDSHWVPTTAFDGPNIRKSLTGVPAEFEMQGLILDAQYVPGGALAVPLDQTVWSLDRVQMELVATRTSTLNECFY